MEKLEWDNVSGVSSSFFSPCEDPLEKMSQYLLTVNAGVWVGQYLLRWKGTIPLLEMRIK